MDLTKRDVERIVDELQSDIEKKMTQSHNILWNQLEQIKQKLDEIKRAL